MGPLGTGRRRDLGTNTAWLLSAMEMTVGGGGVAKKSELVLWRMLQRVFVLARVVLDAGSRDSRDSPRLNWFVSAASASAESSVASAKIECGNTLWSTRGNMEEQGQGASAKQK